MYYETERKLTALERMYIIFRNLTSKDEPSLDKLKRRKSMKRDVRKSSSSIDRLVNCVQLDHEKVLYLKFTEYK